jgi:hypothetical protein
MQSGTINGRLSAEDIKRQAVGRWPDILRTVCGLEDSQLNPRHHVPCPKCGGTDRFRALDDVAETGGLFCNQCHNKGTTPKAGDGFAAVQWARDCTFPEAVRLVADCIGHHHNGHQSAATAKPAKKPKKIHATADKAADAIAYGMVQDGILKEQRRPDAGWRYRNADATDAGAVFRWNLPDGRKEIRQASKVDGGWITSAMPEPRPLYRLPEILEADHVWIVEGEKTADAAVSLGLQATTSAGGSGAAEKSDWSPLNGKRVYILPDNDEPGRKFVAEVIGLIHQQAPAAIVEVKKLSDDWPEIPDGGDLFDWSEYFDSADSETLRARLAEIEDSLSEFVDVDGLNAGKQTAFVDTADEFRPFPVSELPEPLARFCNEVADSVGCDPSFPAMVALSVCSAAIGTTRQVCIKRGWSAPGIIWAVLVGESGTQKSPPFRLAMAPLKARQRRDTDAFTAASTVYKKALSQSDDATAEAPEKPIHTRSIVQDTTIEALAPILSENPRGVLLARDELSGWLAGFDKYSSGKSAVSSEVQRWLEIYNCEAITIDRKTGVERFLFVQRPFVSIAGGIQPGILSRVLTAEHKDNGLQSRLLMTFPPRQPKRWRDDELSQQTETAYSDLVNGLFELKPDGLNDEQWPATLTLSNDAKELYKAYVNRTGSEQAAMHGHLASQWSKLEETPARLAIIIHCVRQVTSGVADHWEIDELTMQSAINLAEWFKNETLRIGRLLSEPDDVRQMRHLANWIHSHGGTITARDLCRNRRDIQTTEQAESLLIQLVATGRGSWRGIQRSREFVLNPQAVSTNGT